MRKKKRKGISVMVASGATGKGIKYFASSQDALKRGRNDREPKME